VENYDHDLTKSQQLSVEYHRAYRKLHYGSLGMRIFSHLIMFAIVLVLLFIFLEKLTFIYSGFASALIQNSIPNLSINWITMFNTRIWVILGQGIYPSDTLLIVIAVLSIIIGLIAYLLKRIPLPIRLGAKVAVFISLVGCVYFWFWSNKFPYDLNDFSSLYVSAEIGMWIAIPAMLTFALMPLPVSIFKKALLIIFTMIYTYVFGSLRYAFFLFILAKFSYLWMSFLYFIFGVFFDFAFMIAFYSFFISLVAPGIFKNRGIWRWLYSS